MSGFYTEADYENSIIELFRGMGYRYVYGPDIDRDFFSPLYEEELNTSLHRLNPSMPEDAISDALFKLKNFENAELIQKNAVFMDYIQHGVEVRYFVKGEEHSVCVKYSLALFPFFFMRSLFGDFYFKKFFQFSFVCLPLMLYPAVSRPYPRNALRNAFRDAVCTASKSGIWQFILSA